MDGEQKEYALLAIDKLFLARMRVAYVISCGTICTILKKQLHYRNTIRLSGLDKCRDSVLRKDFKYHIARDLIKCKDRLSS